MQGHGVADIQVSKAFKFLGLMVGLYASYSVVTGVVYARHRMWGRTISRQEEPFADFTVHESVGYEL